MCLVCERRPERELSIAMGNFDLWSLIYISVNLRILTRPLTWPLIKGRQFATSYSNFDLISDFWSLVYCFADLQPLSRLLTKLWKHIERTAVASFFLEPKKKDSEDQIEKIFVWERKICEFNDNARKAIGKIGKKYTDIVQKQFLSVETSRKWILKKV